MSLFKKCGYVLIVLALLFTGYSKVERNKIYFKNVSFVAEVAKTQEQRERGLMFRKSLASNRCMLFIFEDQALRSFHMKNTYIPLDIIWMDKDKRVVFIKKNAKPANNGYHETISPKKEAMYIIEVNAGTVDKIGLKTGDTLKWAF